MQERKFFIEFAIFEDKVIINSSVDISELIAEIGEEIEYEGMCG